jgi:AcrR family transcriptional regulator
VTKPAGDAVPGATRRSRNRNGADRLATRAVQADGPMPSTERGRRTRDELVRAARVVFERDGYLDARITDIAKEANVAHGTFYSYFPTKESILLAVMDGVNESLYASAVVATEETSTTARVEQSLRQYLRAWTENAAIMGIMLQMAMVNADVRRHRQETADERFRARVERGIRRMQDAGLADPAVSPKYMAQAFGLMVSNVCYEVFVLGGEFDQDELVRTLATIWTRSIGLQDAPPDVGKRP